MTSFVLKIIALVTMFCDHFGHAFCGYPSIFNYIGRIAFPIFAFQISQGYLYTRNLKKYFLRLILFAIISQIPFYLFEFKFITTSPSLNIFFTLLLGLTSIFVYDNFSKLDSSKLNHKLLGLELKKYIAIAIVLLLGLLGEWTHVDYGLWGVLVIFSFYLFHHHKLGMILAFFALCLLKYGSWFVFYGFRIEYLCFFIFTFLPSIFIWFYNGKQGPKIKYLLYVFYPLHLLALYFIF